MSPEAARRAMAEELWLHYWNRILLERGMIQGQEYRKMKLTIENRRPGRGAI